MAKKKISGRYSQECGELSCIICKSINWAEKIWKTRAISTKAYSMILSLKVWVSMDQYNWHHQEFTRNAKFQTIPQTWWFTINILIAQIIHMHINVWEALPYNSLIPLLLICPTKTHTSVHQKIYKSVHRSTICVAKNLRLVKYPSMDRLLYTHKMRMNNLILDKSYKYNDERNKRRLTEESCITHFI